MSAFIRIVVIALLAFLGYYVLLFLMQRQLFYPAPRGPVSTRLPSDVRRIEFRDGDDTGYALYAAAGEVLMRKTQRWLPWVDPYDP